MAAVLGYTSSDSVLPVRCAAGSTSSSKGEYMAVAVSVGASIPEDAYMNMTAISDLVGITKQSVQYAIKAGHLHPVRFPWLRHRVYFRSEVLAWRHRYPWRPTSQELEVLMSAGYAASDFAPATPGEPTTPFEQLAAIPASGSGATSGALVAPADLMAYVQSVMREGQALTASAAALVGEATAGAMRPWAENVRAGVQTPPDMADVGDVASKVVQGAIYPIADTIRVSIAPISDALAQAAQARPAPAADEVTRHMGALRVEVAAMLARMLEAFRPMVERLIAYERVTSEDAAPFMQLLHELTDALADSPYYALAQSALAQIPATIEEMNTLRQAQAQTPAPAPDSVTSETPAGASPSSSKRSHAR
jgi:hypothetical protein